MTPPKLILLTGASGFIAKHIAVKLLNAGFAVRGTVRNLNRTTEIADAVRPHLTNPASIVNLTFASADLESDAGWPEAMAGVDALIHTASPFPIAAPNSDDDLIRPAVQGTLRALKAAQASGVSRVVLTSSVAAVADGSLPPGKPAYDEADWTDASNLAVSAYARSKTLAERAAWDFVAKAPGMALTTINPVFVLGRPLDKHYGSSIGVIGRILNAKDPMVPRFGFAVVDVRDVAEAHLQALLRPDTAGQRYIVADRFLWFQEMAQVIKTAYPARRIVTRLAPDLLLRMLGLFDPQIKSLLPMLGRRDEVSNAAARRDLGISFIPSDQAVLASAEWLIRHGA